MNRQFLFPQTVKELKELGYSDREIHAELLSRDTTQPQLALVAAGGGSFLSYSLR